MTKMTLIDSRIVTARHADAFRDWAERIGAAAEAQPGFVSGLRIEQTGGVFHLVYRFDDADALAAWDASTECERLGREAHDFSTPRREVVEGDLPWVQLPSEADAPKWKRFLMTWAAALPVALAMSALFSALGDPLPALVQAAITSLILVAAMTFIIIPRLSGWLQPWVMKDGEGQARVAD